MKAIKLEQGDSVLFYNGTVGIVEAKFIERERTVVWYDLFKTYYNHNDELLVGRKGRVL